MAVDNEKFSRFKCTALDPLALVVGSLVVFFSYAAGAREISMKVESSSFSHEGDIPSKFTCDGENRSPALRFAGVPAQAKSLALIVDDPDAPAGIWTHWVLYDLPASSTGLPDGVPPVEALENGAKQGINDFRKIGYGGPCPPGGTHRYFFHLYALDRRLEAPAGLSRKGLLQIMQGHILEEAVLMGRYSRKRS